MALLKKCSKCKGKFPRTGEFFALSKKTPNARWSDGLYPTCKTCVSNYQKSRYQNRPDVREKTILAARRKQLALYGLTLEDYDRMLKQQEGVCAICKLPPEQGRRLAVDHDHITGMARSLLCIGCNVTIGYLESIPERLAACAEYMRIHGS